jgi:hypothetical protein
VSACPTAELLRSYLDERLPAAEADAVATHVEHCAHCRAQLSRWAGGASTVAVGLAAGDAAPPQLPGYEVQGRLGAGGMGVVYRALDTKLRRVVALKVLKAGEHTRPEELARFRTEAEVVARLQHPGVVALYEFGEFQGRHFFTMEYCPGGSLHQKLAGKPLPPRAAAELVEAAARAIHAVHQVHVLHRDLKPANVLLGADGRPKIADFGLARKLDAAPTLSGQVLGTPGYMAPEQARGDTKAFGPATDVYGLGAVLYECLTGRPPFNAPDVLETLQLVIHAEPAAPSQVQPRTPRDLNTICLKCLEKEPRRRYAGAADLADDLQRYLNGQPIQARPVGAWERLRKWMRRRPAVAALLAAVALGLALAAAAVGLYFQMLTQQRDHAIAREQSERELRGQAEQERERADRHFEHSLKVTRLLLTQVRDLRHAPQTERLRRDLTAQATGSLAELLRAEPGNPALRLEIGKTLNVLGDLQRDQGELAQAADSHRRALQVLDRLAVEHPRERDYAAERAAAYQNLALAQQLAKQADAAEANYLKALNLLLDLDAEHRDWPVRLRYLAHTRGNLAALYGETDRTEQALALTVQVVADLTELVRAEQEAARRELDRQRLARALDNLGVFHAQQKRPDAARKAMSEALKIREQLVAADGRNADFRHDLARSWYNLARLILGEPLKEEGLVQAQVYLEQAIRTNQDLGNRHRWVPEYRMALVRDYFTLAGLHEARQQPARAREDVRQAVEAAEALWRDFAGENTYRARLAEFLNPYLDAWHARAADLPDGAALQARLAALRKLLRTDEGK